MNRRDFIKSLLAMSAAAALPMPILHAIEKAKTEDEALGVLAKNYPSFLLQRLEIVDRRHLTPRNLFGMETTEYTLKAPDASLVFLTVHQDNSITVERRDRNNVRYRIN